MSESNAQIARRGFDAMLCGDLKVIAEMLDPEVKWHGGDPSRGCQNRAEALEFMRMRSPAVARTSSWST